jgi:hypothetical protein
MELPPGQAPQAPSPENLSPIPMPLVSQIAAPAPALVAPEPEPAMTPVQPSLEQETRKKSTVPRTNNIIQRTWEGHTPPSQSSSGNSGGDKSGSESKGLESLAEDVFPYVKRILEIEADRSSGKLR